MLDKVAFVTFNKAMSHKCNIKPAIRIEIEQELMERIKAGPLATTRGKGAAPWARGLIIEALESYEAIESGRTQLDMEAFRQ